MQAVILAAGEGTRMAPLTPERPKALLPTFDVTQLDWTLTALAQVGVDQVWVSASSAADLIEDQVATQRGARGMAITVAPERPHPLGTAGTLRTLAGELTGAFLVASPAIAHDVDLHRLIQAHISASAAGTILTVPAEEHGEFLLEESWVVDLIGPHEVLAGHRFAGLGIFEREVIDNIPEAPCNLHETVVARLIGQRSLAALEWDGYWRELITPRDHLSANLDVLSGKRDPTVVAAATAAGKQTCQRWDASAFVGQGATVEDVDLRHSVVGSSATIAPGARLERCVVWDGAHVPRGDYRDAVITRTRVVPIR